jgi:homoserine kinase type II
VDDELHDALAAWDLGPVDVRPFGRGMGSRTWLVETDGRGSFVAKASPGGPQLERSLEAAAIVAEAGVRTAAPVRTRSGELTVQIADWRLAVQTFVRGRPADERIPDEVRAWGRTLGRVHRALAGHDELAVGLETLPMIDLSREHLDLEPWIRPAIEPTVADVMRFRGTAGFLHGDPAQEAFLIDSDGEVGVIDWTGCWWGPLLYDVASARMYTGADAFPELLAGYRDEWEVDTSELELFWRFRWCVQASYFSWRVANDVMIGIDDPSENATGLSDARINLTGR